MHKGSNHFTTAMTAVVILVVMLSAFSYGENRGINAQNPQNMTGMMERGDYGNKSLGLHKMAAVNGTINLEQTIFEAIGAKVNTTLSQAITTAEQSVGNNSFAMVAYGGPDGPYFVYTIILGTPSMEFHKVIVDPGTGQVLASQEISHEEWMKMQQMHHMMMMDDDRGGMHPEGMGMMFMDDGGHMKRDRGWK
jgi:hypothetical protein